jgi:hypothetical protein
MQIFSGNKMTDEQLERIKKLLSQYSNPPPSSSRILYRDNGQTGYQEITTSLASALRDFEFIHSNRWHTYFVKDIAASRIDNGPGSRLLASLISELKLELPGPQYTLYSDADLLGTFDPSLLEHSATLSKMTLGTDRQRSEAAEERHKEIKMAWRRFAFAMIGGLALVVPVLVIVVGTTPVKTLLVVTVSIFVFAVGVALFSDAEPENLLAATAAYAAVLMVFISNTNPVGTVGG